MRAHATAAFEEALLPQLLADLRRARARVRTAHEPAGVPSRRSCGRLGAVLGNTTDGLTGTQIAQLLIRCGLPDPGPITKRDRITEALLTEQRRTGSGTQAVTGSPVLRRQRRHPRQLLLAVPDHHPPGA